MSEYKKLTSEERAEWLAGLKIGDKVAWIQHDRVRAVHTIQRETPKHWGIGKDGVWLLSKAKGLTTNIITGVMFEPYAPGMEAAITRQLRAIELQHEREDLLATIGTFSTTRLRTIAKAKGGAA